MLRRLGARCGRRADRTCSRECGDWCRAVFSYLLRTRSAWVIARAGRSREQTDGQSSQQHWLEKARYAVRRGGLVAWKMLAARATWVTLGGGSGGGQTRSLGSQSQDVVRCCVEGGAMLAIVIWVQRCSVAGEDWATAAFGKKQMRLVNGAVKLSRDSSRAKALTVAEVHSPPVSNPVRALSTTLPSAHT